MNDPLQPGKGPAKIYAENFHCKVTNGFHILSLGSGEEESRFVLSLPASKALARALTKQVQEVEKKTGKEVPNLGLSDEPVISPLRIDEEGK